MQPLDDVTVVDLSVTLPGPYASKLLAQLGADVVSVEPPGGDPLHERGPELRDGTGRLYAGLNRGKTCIEVDLKDDRGRAFVRDVVSQSDVFIEGFRPGVVDRLGVGPEVLRTANEDLVYCSLSGYGQTGPRRDEPAHSLNYEALAGLLGTDPGPTLPGLPVADFVGGLMVAFAATVALRARDRNGGGQYVDIGMFEVLASWNQWHAPWVEADDSPFDGDPLVGGEYPCYNVYRTADGEFLTLGILETAFWDEFCRLVGVEEVVDDQFATGGRSSDAYEKLQEAFLSRPLDEWEALLSESVPMARVQSPREALSDPQTESRGVTYAVDTTTGETLAEFGFPAAFDGFDPSRPSSDGTALFTDAGYAPSVVAELEDEAVLSRIDPGPE